MACKVNKRSMEHCWHLNKAKECVEGAITVLPEICCHCGDEREELRIITQDGKQHGKFLPKED